MPLFTFGEQTVPFLGNPHALAMQDNGFVMPQAAEPNDGTFRDHGFDSRASGAHAVGGDTNPYSHRTRLTDAVIAASNVLNKARGDSSIMGDDLDMEEVKKTDQLVRCLAQVGLTKGQYLGDVRLVRLGLFVDDYRRFRQAVAMKQVLDDIIAQKAVEYRQRACGFASEILNLGRPKQAEGGVKWKNFAIVAGIAVAAAVGWNLWRGWKGEGRHQGYEPEHEHEHEHAQQAHVPHYHGEE